MQFSTVLSAALLFISPVIVSAAPADHQFQRRACPTVDTIRTWLRENRSIGPNTVFYTANAPSAQAQFFSNTLNPVGNYWGAVYNDNAILDQWFSECGVGPEQDNLLPRMGQALALESTGTAYVLMSPGQAIRPFWENNEYPSLANRVSIIAVNADDFAQTQTYVHPNNPF